MKRWIWLGIVCAMAHGVSGSAGDAQGARHRVVFEFVSEGVEQMNSVLNNVENSLKALGPATEILVVAHGPGLGLVMKTNTPIGARMQSLSDKHVVFAACENTLKRKQVGRQELLPGVITVDSGVAEVIRRQSAGWAYVKSGH